MPKKKLNKTRVKALLNSANTSIYKLALDRLQHGTGSLIPISSSHSKRNRSNMSRVSVWAELVFRGQQVLEAWRMLQDEDE
jgi:hypothetical protein